MMEAIGGRKFLMAILMLLAGVAIEIVGKNGLSVNMAGLMAALYTAFSASNAIITNKQLSTTTEQSEQPAQVGLKIEDVKPAFDAIDQAFVKMQQDQAQQAQVINTLQKAIQAVMIKP